MFNQINSSTIPYHSRQSSEIYLNNKFLRLWPDLRALSLLTIGKIPYPFIQKSAPYFHVHGQFIHNSQTITNQLHPSAIKTCCFSYHQFPFQECSFDRILYYPAFPINLYHLNQILRSYWQILKDDGKILLLLPNKLKWWGIFNLFTFYQNQKNSFSVYQLKNILKEHMFQLVYYEKIIYFPTEIMNFFSIYGNKLFEFLGHFFIPFGGAYHLIEIRKELYAPIMLPSVSANKILKQNLSRPNLES